MLIRSSRRRIHNQILQSCSPIDAPTELRDHGILFGATPDDGIVLVGQDEGDAHDGHFSGEAYRFPAVNSL